MPEFVNPFSGMVPDRTMSREELIRAIRLDIAAEEEAAYLYNSQADATDDPKAAEILRDIANEEIVHVGEFQKLLVQLSPEEEELMNKGAGEVIQKIGSPGILPEVPGIPPEIPLESKTLEEGIESYVDDFLYKWQESGELPREFSEAVKSYWKNWKKSWLNAKLQFLSELEERIPDFSDEIEELKDDVVKYSEKPEYYKSYYKRESRTRMNILEAKDLQVYKLLLRVLGDYSDKFPATGVDRMFDQAVENGKRVLPKDQRAIEILYHILSSSSVPMAVHKLLNLRFSGLPINLRPLVKNGRKKEVAFWTRDALVSDKIKDLIDFEVSGKSGYWSDVDGNKVSLLDISERANEQTTVEPKRKPGTTVPTRIPKEKPKNPIVPVPHQRPEPKGVRANKDVELFKKRRVERS
jgi:rubrerythrin